MLQHDVDVAFEIGTLGMHLGWAFGESPAAALLAAAVQPQRPERFS